VRVHRKVRPKQRTRHGLEHERAEAATATPAQPRSKNARRPPVHAVCRGGPTRDGRCGCKCGRARTAVFQARSGSPYRRTCACASAHACWGRGWHFHGSAFAYEMGRRRACQAARQVA
jgi:hypothetical protein